MSSRERPGDRGLEREVEEERRLRRARITSVTGEAPEPPSEGTSDTDEDGNAPGQRMEQQALWVDLQVRRAMERGDFDDLPGAGKPIRGLGATHDPDWWVKSLIAREKITGVLPPALGLRTEDARLDDVLDRETTEDGVRRVVVDFNRRVVEARRQLQGGPPVVTATRDVETEVIAWRARQDERREAQRAELGDADPASDVPPEPRRRRWRRWRRRRGS